MEELGNRIKTARGELTQREFAEQLNYDKTTVASWEIGRREPIVKALKRVADFSGVSMDWLAGRYDCDVDKAKVLDDPRWRGVIAVAANNNIRPEELESLIAAIVAIKNK